MHKTDRTLVFISCVLLVTASASVLLAQRRAGEIDARQARQRAGLMHTRDAISVMLEQTRRVLASESAHSEVASWNPKRWLARVQHHITRAAGPSFDYAFELVTSDVSGAPGDTPLAWHTVVWTFDAKVRHGPEAVELLNALDVALGGMTVESCRLEKIPARLLLSCTGYKQALEQLQ